VGRKTTTQSINQLARLEHELDAYLCVDVKKSSNKNFKNDKKRKMVTKILKKRL